MGLIQITRKLRAFRDERDWAQFHNPKDMAFAISIEASEILEHFLWKNPDEFDQRVESKREEIEDEIVDVGVCLTEFADNRGVDLLEAVGRELGKNVKKYPVDKAKGSHAKYTEL